MIEEITRRDFLKKTTSGLAGLAAGLYLLDGCRLREDVNSIYNIEEIGDRQYLVIKELENVYELEKMKVNPGDGYNDLIFRGIRDYDTMSSNNEHRLPEILRDINGGGLIASDKWNDRFALGPTKVIPVEEYKQLKEKHEK